MAENNGVDYRDGTPLSQIDIERVNNLVEQGDYQSAGKLISNFIKTKKYGKATRGAMALWAENMGHTAVKSNETANYAQRIASDINERFNEQIAGSTNNNEVIDLRHSQMLDKSFETASLRGNFWDQEFEGQYINVKWYGMVGDGTTDNSPVWENLISKYSNTADDVQAESIKTVTFYFPKGNYFFAKPLWLTSGIKLKGYSSRRWYKDTDDSNYTQLTIKNTIDDPAIRITGFNKDGSIPSELVQQDDTIAGVAPYFAENISIEDMSLQSADKIGIGINALNTIFSTFKNLSLVNFDIGFVGSCMWGSQFEKILTVNPNVCGMYFDSFCGGMSLRNISINNNSTKDKITNDFGLDALLRGKYPNRATGLVLNNLTTTHLDNIVIEHFPVHAKIVDSDPIQITNLHTEFADYGVLDVDNSIVNVQTGYDYEPDGAASTVFNAVNNSHIKVNNYHMTDYYTHVWQVDNTSTLIISESNIQKDIRSTNNVTIFRYRDYIRQEIPLTIEFVSSDNKIHSDNTTFLNQKGTLVRQGALGFYYYAGNVAEWDSMSDGYANIVLSGSKNQGILSIELSDRIDSNKEPPVITGQSMVIDGTRAPIINDSGFVPLQMIKNFKTIHISGTVLNDI